MHWNSHAHIFENARLVGVRGFEPLGIHLPKRNKSFGIKPLRASQSRQEHARVNSV